VEERWQFKNTKEHYYQFEKPFAKEVVGENGRVIL
jgi:hypothetical protein